MKMKKMKENQVRSRTKRAVTREREPKGRRGLGRPKKKKKKNYKKMEPGGGKKPTGSAKPMKKGPASEPPLRAVGANPHRREDGDVGEGEEESVDRHQLSYRPMRADWNALREKQQQRKRERDNSNDHNDRHHRYLPRLQAEVLRFGRPFWKFCPCSPFSAAAYV